MPELRHFYSHPPLRSFAASQLPAQLRSPAARYARRFFLDPETWVSVTCAPMSRVIVVANFKGGVGKTMMSMHTAAIGAEIGKSIALVDTDPQGSLAQWKKRTEKAGKPTVDVLRLRAADLVARLADPKDDLRTKYEFVIVDTPPTAEKDSIELITSLSAKDYVIVPVTPGGTELDALQSTLDIVPSKRTRLILNRADERAISTRKARRFLERTGLPVSVVRDSVKFSNITLEGGTVLSNYNKHKSAFDIRRLGRELWS